MPIQYPHSAPEPGTPKQVAPGIYWLRFGLPIELDHINLYLLEDDAGWYIVDCGMNLEESKQQWLRLFQDFLGDKPVLAVIVTHMHPDHVGLAGWLCEHWKAPLWMSLGEYFGARVYSNMRSEVSWTTAQFYHQAGLGEDYIEFLGGRLGMFSKIVSPMPAAYRRLKDGDALLIGGRNWQVITAGGHSPEHVCLYCEQERLLLSGDQLIAKISSNVSVMATEPEANPLQDWFEALHRLRQLPADCLAMPSHNKPFHGIHTRINELREHHQDHLLAVLEACVEPKTAVQLLPVLFSRAIDFSAMSLAMGECIAHLHYLLADGKLSRIPDEHGVYCYQTLDPDALAEPRQRHGHIDDEMIMV